MRFLRLLALATLVALSCSAQTVTGTILGVVIYTSIGKQDISCEVCIEFNGRTQCASASGATRQEATPTESITTPLDSDGSSWI